MSLIENPKQTIKENPIKTTISLIVSVSTLVGILFALDGRYAHADDVNSSQKQVQSQLFQMQYDSIDGKIFEMELKKSSNPKEWNTMDETLLNKYKRDLEKITTQKKEIK